MRDLSLQNDPGVPIEATLEQKRSIEGRWDITKRRAALDKAKLGGEKEEVAKAKAVLDQRRRILYNLLVMGAREKYFAEASLLRAQGKLTDELRKRSRPSKRCSDHALLDVGGLMQFWTGRRGFGNRSGSSEELVFDYQAKSRSEKAMVWLVRYAARAWSLLTLVLPVSASTATIEGERKVTTPDKATPEKRFTCLLCKDKSYSQRSSSTRHSKVKHIDGDTFGHPFSCPRCYREVLNVPTNSDPEEWSNHVEQQHGKIYAPMLTKACPDGYEASKAPARRPRKIADAKRKRDETKEASTPRVLVLDFSEEPQRKKAHTSKEKASFLSLKAKSPSSVATSVLEIEPCSPRLGLAVSYQNVEDIFGSSTSDDNDSRGGFSRCSSGSMDTPIESPVTPNSEVFPIHHALAESTSSGTCGALITYKDAADAGWERVEKADATGQEMGWADDDEEWQGFDD